MVEKLSQTKCGSKKKKIPEICSFIEILSMCKFSVGSKTQCGFTELHLLVYFTSCCA